MIKAIETEYNGYRFRSRLEARWAVFFDNLGIKYEYEKEGFDVNGTRYLPDFWLPEQDCWYEVKGSYTSTDPMWDDWARLFDFCQQTQKWVYVARGEIHVPDTDSVPGHNFPSAIGGFDPSLPLDDPRKAYPGRKFPEPFMMWVQSNEGRAIEIISSMERSDDQVITPRIIDAYTRARQARFEHKDRWMRKVNTTLDQIKRLQ